MSKKAIAAAFLILLFTSLYAHEYILLASKYLLQKGETIDLHLLVADGFNVEGERTYQEKMTAGFELITNNSVIDLKKGGNENSIPVAQIKVDFDGLGLLHLERNYASIVLEANKFRDYLKEDHIENIKLDPKETRNQKEKYTRYIKCLVQSTQLKNDTLHKKIIGQQYEIILLQNPYQLKAGQPFSAKILFRGKPLSNKMIFARNRMGNEAAALQTARTNKEGVCSFRVTRGGEWFLHTTHMIPNESSSDHNWESFWASYSFGMK